jgi:hypothetical protein
MLKYAKTLAFAALVGFVGTACSSSDPAPTASTPDATLVVGEYTGNYTTLLGSGQATVKLSSPSQATIKILVAGLPTIGELSLDAKVSAPVNNVISFTVDKQTDSKSGVGVSAKGGKNPTGTYNTTTKQLVMDLDVTIPNNPVVISVNYIGTKK